MSLLRTYSRLYATNPSLTLLVANGVLMGSGDIIAQSLSIAGSPLLGAAFDPARTFRFAFFGASMGPLAGAWNKFLEVKFPLRPVLPPSPRPAPATEKFTNLDDAPLPEGLKQRLPKGAKLERGTAPPPEQEAEVEEELKYGEVNNVQVLKRVAADQLGMAPISLFIFLFSMGMMEGLEPEEIQQKIKENYFGILFVGWQIWPLFQLINFRYIPLQYRVPIGSLAGIAWTCFLSLRTNKEA